MNQIIPGNGRILVKPIINNDRKTSGGLILPPSSKEEPVKAVVLAVSSNYNDQGVEIPNHIKIDDIIIFDKWSGTKVIIEKEERFVVKHSDILVIIR